MLDSSPELHFAPRQPPGGGLALSPRRSRRLRPPAGRAGGDAAGRGTARSASAPPPPPSLPPRARRTGRARSQQPRRSRRGSAQRPRPAAELASRPRPTLRLRIAPAEAAVRERRGGRAAAIGRSARLTASASAPPPPSFGSAQRFQRPKARTEGHGLTISPGTRSLIASGTRHYTRPAPMLRSM
jgi:hypothetical protein